MSYVIPATTEIGQRHETTKRPVTNGAAMTPTAAASGRILWDRMSRARTGEYDWDDSNTSSAFGRATPSVKLTLPRRRRRRYHRDRRRVLRCCRAQAPQKRFNGILMKIIYLVCHFGLDVVP